MNEHSQIQGQYNDMQQALPPYMQGLNAPQREAVETIDGPLLVLAGAGTGKTRVLTTRLAHILATRRAMPGEILAVTFTNKAAGEMRERVSHLLGGAPVEGWWLGTFHALAARMLRRHAERVGLRSDFTIIDTDDQLRLLKQIIEVNGIDSKKWVPKMLLSVIDRWKDRGLTPQQVAGEGNSAMADGKMPDLYRQYQERLKTVNACDFGDLLLHMIRIFRDPEHADILDGYRRRFRYIMVDEYQDTNVAQYLWLQLLSGGRDNPNICCVGDDDQSIYGWRGAEVGNILRFERDFPGAKIVRLEQNYRSTGNILAAASGVIANNQGRLGKTLWSEADKGEKVTVYGVWDGDAEARWITSEIEKLHTMGQPYSTCAILVRAGFQMRAFEERLIQTGIPYQVIGGPRFYERMEIRDAMAYLRVTVQPDDDLALERIINTPKRGIGPGTIQQLYTYARGINISLHESILRLVETDDLKPKVRETLRRLTSDFERWRMLIPTMDHGELAGLILDESGYTAMWQQDKSPDAPGRLENLKELVSAMGEFESLATFMEHVSLVMDNQEDRSTDKVTLMTLHGAKGLEFNNVFLPGWEDGLFPSQRSMDENGLSGLEEERRLAYVGLTRARVRATITYAGNRQMYGSWVNAMPSRFIEEIPAEFTEKKTEGGFPSGMRTGMRSDNGGGFNFQPHRDDGNHFSGVIETKDYRVINARYDEAESKYRKGVRVMHQTFGEGVIIAADGDKLEIVFAKEGRKKIMARFVTLL